MTRDSSTCGGERLLSSVPIGTRPETLAGVTQLDASPKVSPAGPALPMSSLHTSRWERVRSLVVGELIVGGLTIAVHFRDPHRHGSWGLCPLYALTGIYCPGCGGMRAVNDVTNGNLRAAISSNVLAVTLLPMVVLWWLRSRWRGDAWVPLARRHATTTTYVLTAVAFVFMIVRNTPWGAALAP